MNNRLRCAVVAVLLVLVFPLVAGADASPFPRWNRHLSIQVQFENLDAFSRYDFFLSYHLEPGAGARNRVFPGTPIILEGTNVRSLVDVHLIAVPHTNPVPPALQTAKDHEWPTNTIRSAALPGNQGTDHLSLEADGYSLVYHVDLEGDLIEVTRVSEEAPPNWWRGPTLAGGVALSMVLVAVVLGRWKRGRLAV